CPVQGINKRTSTGGNQDFIRIKLQSFTFFYKPGNGFAQSKNSISRRISSKFISVSFYNLVFQFFWNRKYRRIKIADGKIVNLFTAFYFFFYFSSKTHNLAANQRFSQVA